MDCFHLWVKNTGRGICSAWGNVVNFFCNFSFESRQDVTFWVVFNNVPKIFSLEPFLQRLEKRLSFSLPKYAVRGKMTGSGSLMEASQFSFFFLFGTSQDVTFWVNVNNVPKIFSLQNRPIHFLTKKMLCFLTHKLKLWDCWFDHIRLQKNSL